MPTKDLRCDSVLSVFTQRDGTTYTLEVSGDKALRNTIPLFNTPWNIRPIQYGVGSKIIVEQPETEPSPAPSADEMYIIDGHSGALLDQFACEQPSLSPDGRYLAFVAKFPHHAQIDDTTSNFVTVYDLMRNTVANRHQNRHDFPLADDPDDQAGIQVFPKTRVLSGGPESRKMKMRIYGVISKLVWSSGSDRLLFAINAEPGEGLGSGIASYGHVSVSSRHHDLPSIGLVAVGLDDDHMQLSQVDLPECAGVSGNTCSIGVENAVFGRSAVTIPLVVKGGTTETKTVILKN